MDCHLLSTSGEGEEPDEFNRLLVVLPISERVRSNSTPKSPLLRSGCTISGQLLWLLHISVLNCINYVPSLSSGLFSYSDTFTLRKHALVKLLISKLVL